MNFSQVNPEAINEVFSSIVIKRKTNNYVRTYRSIARWTSSIIKKLSASSKKSVGSGLDNQDLGNTYAKAFAIIKDLIQLRYENLELLERHLIETAHELNASLKDSKDEFLILCAVILGAKEHIRILPTLTELACSGEDKKSFHKEIQLLIAIAIEVEKWNDKAKVNNNQEVKVKTNGLTSDIQDYFKAKQIDPLYPRLVADQRYFRDQLRVSINQRLFEIGLCPALESEMSTASIRLSSRHNLFADYKYNGRQTDKQGLILLNVYINEMDIRRIFISYPKSGRTWLRMMLSEIDKKKDFKFTHLMANPWFTTTTPDHFVLPSYKKDLAVFLHRDPRDVVVSQYHQIHKRDIPHKESLSDGDGKKLAISDFVRTTMPPPLKLEDFIFCPHWGFNRIAKFNTCVLKSCDIGHIWNYESMSLYPKSTMSDLCSFLALGAAKSIIYESIDNNNFSDLLKAELAPDAIKGRASGKLYENHDLSDINARKFRKGKVGGWAEEVDPRDHEKLISMTKKYYLNLLEICPNSMRKQLFIPEDISKIIGRAHFL